MCVWLWAPSIAPLCVVQAGAQCHLDRAHADANWRLRLQKICCWLPGTFFGVRSEDTRRLLCGAGGYGSVGGTFPYMYKSLGLVPCNTEQQREKQWGEALQIYSLRKGKEFLTVIEASYCSLAPIQRQRCMRTFGCCCVEFSVCFKHLPLYGRRLDVYHKAGELEAAVSWHHPRFHFFANNLCTIVYVL